jgi:DtxR family transcriptional regulator, Mn-dependent transcriptional regulator
LSASLEDYLEAILNVTDDSGAARSSDIARSLAVARPSVTGALKLLAKKGLVNYRPYGSVSLTQAGLARAAKVAKKHDILESFFMDFLGLDHSVAHPAACKTEHIFNPAIVARMADFTDFARKHGRQGEGIMSILERFSKSREVRR